MPPSTELSYLQAVVIGLLQGVTELFPISSLGHSVLVPAWIGGSWEHLVTEGTQKDSTYLAFIVALHVATAVALLVFYARDWVGIIGGLVTVLRTRTVATSTQRLAVLIIIATIPVGILGLALEKTLRALFATPEAAAVFLTLNGVILLAGELLRRNAANTTGRMPGGVAVGTGVHRRLDTLDYKEAAFIGVFQSLALLAGISRSGVSIVGGLVRGLDHEDAAKFAFLLATPVILAAGVYKLPELAGPSAAHIHGQILVGAAVAGVAAYASLRFLVRYFHTRTLLPFVVYSLVAGVISLVHFA